MNVGDTVRPIVSLAGLDSRRMYRVLAVEETPFGMTLAYLGTADGAALPVENAHLFLEVVKSSTVRPAAARMN